MGFLFAKAEGGTFTPLPDARVINVNYLFGVSAEVNHRNSEFLRRGRCS